LVTKRKVFSVGKTALNAVVQAGGLGSSTDFECKAVSAAAVHRQLVEVYGNDVMNGQSMANWCAQFRTERISTDDVREVADPQREAHQTIRHVCQTPFSTTEEIRLEELEHDFSLPHGTVVTIIQGLGVHEVCALWMSRELS